MKVRGESEGGRKEGREGEGGKGGGWREEGRKGKGGERGRAEGGGERVHLRNYVQGQ